MPRRRGAGRAAFTRPEPRDTGPQLRRFLAVLAQHRKQIEEQLAELQANLEEVKAHEREAKALLARAEKPRERLKQA